jgi:ABC-type nitrate/sulfonate/bicarbonate transport system substrate-binding protein
MRRTKPQLILGLSALALFMFVNVSVLNAQKLRVAYTAFAGTFTILWVGKDAGLYQKYGADMELLYIGSSTRAVQALLAGDIDIVYSAAGAVVDANLAGADLTMVGCQYDTGQSSFFQNRDHRHETRTLRPYAKARQPGALLRRSL